MWEPGKYAKAAVQAESDTPTDRIRKLKESGGMYSSRYYYLAGSALGFAVALLVGGLATIDSARWSLRAIDVDFVAACSVGWAIAALAARATMKDEVGVVDAMIVHELREELGLAEAPAKIRPSAS
jgi:hypothetical protein